MAHIVFIEPDGTRRVVEAQPGRSIMRNATANDIRGIIGECGGCASCGTCHAHIGAAWADRLNTPSDDEAAMLEGLDAATSDSRLTCQIMMSEDLDGIVVTVP